MAFILNIETSTSICSAALAKDGKVISSKESHGAKTHASHLTTFIEEVISTSGISFQDLDGVAVSKGPGSYTGLRIGVSTAKGIAYALGIPVISICTLLIMVKGLYEEMPDIFNNRDYLFCPMLDARRMEVYLALYNHEMNNEPEVKAEILNEKSFLQILKNQRIVFFGNGVIKCRNLIRHENAIFIEQFNPLARYMAGISYSYFLNKNFVNMAYFEPFYLKDFIATTPKNLLKHQPGKAK